MEGAWTVFKKKGKSSIQSLILLTYPILLYPVYKILLIRIFSVVDNKCLKAPRSLVFNLKFQKVT
jgi:hypothetical protein